MKMRKTKVPPFTAVVAIAVVLIISLLAQAQDASEAVYKSKCVSCHAADGRGSAMGKKLGTHDFQTDAVQKLSDTELTDTTTSGKNKMPAYGKSLKAEDVKGLVAYIRTLKKS
jgi:mono/diheme cytochrome c family protein